MSSISVAVNDLRKQPGRYIDLAAGGHNVIITSHGKPRARLVSIDSDPSTSGLDAICGIWANREDMVDPLAYVQGIRTGRFL